MTVEGKWTFNSTYDDIWYHEKYDTREEAIREGKKYFGNREEEFFIGRCTQEGLTKGCSADNVLEDVAQFAYELAGDVSLDYLQSVKREHKAILQERLNKVVDEWMRDFGYNPSFHVIL